MKNGVIVILFCFMACCSTAQRLTPEQYIEQYRDIAIREMKRTGVPAAITLAQGILETESGNSELVKKSNNHFGIKCKNTWTGTSVTHDDDLKGECFRSYETAEESFRDHSNFLRGNPRYGNLFKIDVTDYNGWARGLKRAGYATNPLYPQILIKNIEQYNLQQYTLLALGDVTNPDLALSPDGRVVIISDSLKAVAANRARDSAKVNVTELTDKIIMINKCRCVPARKGTSLLAIATRNDINLGKLLEYNDLGEDGLLGRDQLVYLQKKSRTGDTAFYTVQPGETAYDIAQKKGMQLSYLLDYNKLKKEDVLTAGTRLFLIPGLKAPDTKKAELNKITIHIVNPKEGLYGIAKKYNVTVQQLKEWNKLVSDELQVGQKLIVSK